MSKIIIRNRLDSEALPGIVWSEVTYTGDVPRWMAQRRLQRDPVSGQIITYAGDALSSGIYSDTIFAMNPNTLVSTRIGGTPPGNNSAAPDYPDSTAGQWNNGDGSDKQPWPSDRHPDFMTAIDTLRNVWWLFSGLALGNPGSGDGTCWNDLWSLSLNADPTDNEFTNHALSVFPTVTFNGCLVHHPVYDLLILHGSAGSSGFPRTWVYAPTDSLSANQTTAGCTAPKTWSVAYSPASVAPPYPFLPNVHYYPPTGTLLIFAWDGSDVPIITWEYNVLAKTWTNLAPAGAPINKDPSSIEFLTSYITAGSLAGQILFHRTGHTQSVTPAQVADFVYDRGSNRWTQLESTGTGPSTLTFIEFDPTLGDEGTVIAHESNSGKYWHGVVTI